MTGLALFWGWGGGLGMPSEGGFSSLKGPFRNCCGAISEMGDLPRVVGGVTDAGSWSVKSGRYD